MLCSINWALGLNQTWKNNFKPWLAPSNVFHSRVLRNETKNERRFLIYGRVCRKRNVSFENFHSFYLRVSKKWSMKKMPKFNMSYNVHDSNFYYCVQKDINQKPFYRKKDHISYGSWPQVLFLGAPKKGKCLNISDPT